MHLDRIIVQLRLDAAFPWVRANQAELLKGVWIGLAAVSLLLLTDSVGLKQKQATDPILRVAHGAGGEFSARGLKRISAGMSPYARGLSMRLAGKGGEWSPRGLEGWQSYDVVQAPALLKRNLTFEEARAFNALVAPISGPIPALKPFLLQAKDAERARAELCLTQAVYYEAGFESGEGQQAVAQVILNRLRHPAYPKSVCGVVYQGSQRTTGCQFSFTCDGSLARQPSIVAWERARYVARTALNGFVYAGVGTSTHYHADYVFPYWAVTLVKLKQIGAHVFYRMTGPSGATTAFSGKYAGGETVLSADILSGGDARTPDAPSVVIAPLPGTAAPQQTMTITLGGETRTYLVGQTQPGAPPPSPANVPPGTVVAGTIAQTRRLPTVEEMQDINEKLRMLEEKQAATKAAGKSGLPGDK